MRYSFDKSRGYTLLIRQKQRIYATHSTEAEGIRSIKNLSVSRQVNSLFQTEFSKECDLELPPSTSSIFLFP
jgi:hypothetical protein